LVEVKAFWRRIRPAVLSNLIFCVIIVVVKTLRVKIIHRERLDESGEGKIACMWHGRTIIPAFGRFWKNFWVIISLSRDGEMQARIYKKIGFSIIRGSTGRGGARAAVESVRVLKDNGLMAITPDGPKGPSGTVQDGVVFLARKSGAGLYPLGISCKHRLLVPSWDKYLVPMPFSKAIIIIGEPIYLAKDATPEEEEAVRLKLEQEMHRLEDEAEKAMGF
jgi:lysophospholipid acyltransferase (LPLAT)-like uncharacterized protein